ncbi:MAG: T9SS type A sorting domain-containing protein [Lewinellaceae bacterium]|nr:T9SS type A sorting domain-containing protein [Saprospiraceae bacterium]MCB9342190.1 T9SS type A sorting domain-containing protein [Lewinellaceae bacterium]
MMITKNKLLILCLIFVGTLFSNNWSTATNPKPILTSSAFDSDCDLPAPDDFEPIEIGTSWVKLSWTPVGPTPARYIIRTYLGSNGNLVDVSNVPGTATTWKVLNLSSNTEYRSTITPVCDNNVESQYNIITDLYKTLIIDLILSGYTPPQGLGEGCTIYRSNGTCLLNSAGSTDFGISDNLTEPNVSRNFEVNLDQFPTIELTLEQNGDFDFYCENNVPPNPHCLTKTVYVKNNNDLVATMELISPTYGPPYITCTYLNGNYKVTRKDAVLKPITGTNEISGIAFSVSPNPFTDQLNVDMELSGETDQATLALYDLQGRLMITQMAQKGSRNQSINTSNLAPGMYLLHINASAEKRILKVVKTQ